MEKPRENLEPRKFEDEERESLKVKEITFENLTNKDLLKAIIIWYEKGNRMLDLAKRWGKRFWDFYQKNPEEFLKQGHDPDMSLGEVKSDLFDYGTFERRFGFRTGRFGDYSNPDSKLRLVFDKEDKELDKRKRKIKFWVDTNDLGNQKEYRQANYLLAKNITEAWEKERLPVYQKFGHLSEEEEKEILEIAGNEEKLKEFWQSLSTRKFFKKEYLKKYDKQEEERKKEFGLELE